QAAPDLAQGNNNMSHDLAMASPDLAMASNPDLANSGACTSYTATSIAALRQSGQNYACVSLSGVVAIALHASTASPKLYVQDAAGGDWSALPVHCSSTSTTHPCTQQALVNAIAVGHAVGMQATYTKGPATSGSLETLYLATISDQGVGTAPAAIALGVDG